MNEVLKKWFEPRFKDSTFSFEARGYPYDTPLANAHYEPHFKSRREVPNEPDHLKYADQTVQHLKAREYADVWGIWLECKASVKSQLEKVVKVWEDIEKKLVTNLPAKFDEWDSRGTGPPNCYILDNTVWEIYREAEILSGARQLEQTSFKRDDSEKAYVRVGTATLYAKSSDESLGNEFIRITHSIIKDENLQRQLKTLNIEKEKIDSLVEKFKEALNKIVDDFEKGHTNLKGTCWRCKDWHDELVRLG